MLQKTRQFDTEKAARNWLRLLDLSGPNSQTWAESYRQSGVSQKIRATQDALLLLREGKSDDAMRILSGIGMICTAENEDSDSMRLLLQRFYFPVIAYHFYRAGDLREAWASLERAEQAIQRIIENHPYLIAMAESFIDFGIQKARIARSQRDWKLMWRCLQKVSSMASNRSPLCTTERNQEIYFSTIANALSSLDLAEEEVRAWREVVDDQVRQSIAERLIREVCTLPGFIIDY